MRAATVRELGAVLLELQLLQQSLEASHEALRASGVALAIERVRAWLRRQARRARSA